MSGDCRLSDVSICLAWDPSRSAWSIRPEGEKHSPLVDDLSPSELADYLARLKEWVTEDVSAILSAQSSPNPEYLALYALSAPLRFTDERVHPLTNECSLCLPVVDALSDNSSSRVCLRLHDSTSARENVKQGASGFPLNKLMFVHAILYMKKL